MAEIYGYSAGYSSNKPIRVAGEMTKVAFVKTVVAVDIDHTHSTFNWVYQRVGKTGNNIEISLAKLHTGKVVFHHGGEVLKVVPVNNQEREE